MYRELLQSDPPISHDDGDLQVEIQQILFCFVQDPSDFTAER